jgi:hypothetical protein
MRANVNPLTPRDYFERTSHVVRNLYLGIASCHQLWEEATAFWTPGGSPVPKTEKERAELYTFVAKSMQYFSSKLSEGILCGAILQIASSAILRFSKNATLPIMCRRLFEGIKPREKQLKFCIGRDLHGIPEGLIIYAGRNQYAHWEEEELRDELNVRVFETLNATLKGESSADLPFDLSNPTMHIYADFLLLGILQWKTYGEYLKGMRRLVEV